MPYWPEIISAVTRQNQQVPMPMDRPVTMLGAAPGNTTCVNRAKRPVPRLRAEAISRASTPSTPWMVLSRMGNSAPTKVMKIMLPSDEGNIRMASGIQATAGMGRATSSGGNRLSCAQRERPMTRPRPTPSTAASAKPRAMRPRLLLRCWTSRGECSRSQADCSTSAGGGTLANVTSPR